MSRVRPVWVVGVGIVAALLLGALFRDALTSYQPSAVDVAGAFLPPFSAGHPLGTDQVGRDQLSRVLAAAPVSLLLGAMPATLGMLIGGLIGVLAGLRRGPVDRLVMAATDVLLAFPFILIAVMILVMVGSAGAAIIIAVTIAVLPRNIRVVRAETLSLREREFVIAARLAGASQASLVLRHILPNVMPTMMIIGSVDIGRLTAATAGLSYLGLGVKPPSVDWGLMIADGAPYITVAPLLAIVPSLIVALVSVVFTALGDDLRHQLA